VTGTAAFGEAAPTRGWRRSLVCGVCDFPEQGAKSVNRRTAAFVMGKTAEFEKAEVCATRLYFQRNGCI